jgi:hypothetical protein
MINQAMNSQHKKTLVNGYTQLVTDRTQNGWSCHLLTVLFDQLHGPEMVVVNRMRDELQRLYSTFLTRVHRNPKRASSIKLPILIGSADLPVYKRDRSSSPSIRCNGGLHFHALLVIPPLSRLKEAPSDHFKNNLDLYAGPGRAVQRIDIRPVVESPERVVDYVLKTILNGKLSYDDAILVLPRTTTELTAG